MIHFEFTMQRRHLVVFIAIVVTSALLIPGVAWASNRFIDVSDANTFHEDITWMADAGVTMGCNPPANDKFCPDAFVTRQQMAAFMHRLAQNKVVDAGRLDGLDSTGFAPSDIIGTSIMTASVAPLGTPFGGGLNGPTGVIKSGVGQYVVTFDRDVENCVAATNDIIFLSNLDVSADPTTGASNQIVVKVRNDDNTAYVDTYWSMIVVCPDGAALASVESSPNTP
jgi:hypothetical protein